MLSDELKNGIRQLRPFVPARDHARSHAFYSALGFEAHPIGPTMTHFQLGRFAFILENYDYESPGYNAQAFAENFVMHMMVDDVDAWWRHVGALNLAERFGVQAPRAPKDEPWGLRVMYLFDPAGVLWHVATEVPATATA